MKSSKSTCEMYRISANGEYATVCLSDWSRDVVGHPSEQRYGGEILVHSSFGVFCHQWSNCGLPFKAFLLEIEFESFMSKCLGNDFLQFDGRASVDRVKKAILETRHAEGLSAEEARELWDDVSFASDTAEGSEPAFYVALEDICSEENIGSTSEFVVRKPSSQAQSFWNELWPHFLAMLEAELKSTTETAVQAA